MRGCSTGRPVRLGGGSIDVLAEAGSGTYRTVVTQAVPARLTIGHTVPAGARVHRATLNGNPAKYTVPRRAAAIW